MAIQRLSGIALLALLAIVLFPSISSAQYRPHHRPLRWLGQGFGDGFNRCNPGPNSDYYNPYSVHNSYLVSQSPQFSQQRWNSEQLIEMGTLRQGVPFSIYAAPQPRTSPNPGPDRQFIEPLDSIEPIQKKNSRRHPLEFFYPKNDRE